MSGAMIKGIIMNMSTGSLRTFQFNPNNISYGREAVYAEIGSPGMSYPRHQYVSGRAREFSVTLFMYDHPYTGKIDSFRAFLEDFLPPEYNTRTFIKPPQMLFFYGTFLKKCVCRGTSTLQLRPRTKMDLTNASFVTVVEGDTLDGIAYKQYQDASLWWAILDANPKYQHEVEIKAGDVLTVPPLSEVVRVSGHNS